MQDNSIPQGFAQALARNEAAVNAYAMMTREEKESVLAKARNAHSNHQMQEIIRMLETERHI